MSNAAPITHRLLQLATIATAVAALALFFATPAGVAPVTMRAAALTLLVVGLWALGTLPEHVSSLLFFLLAMLFGIAPAQVVFSGFATATLWLVLSGLVIAEAVNRTGLGRRIAAVLFDRFSQSYLRLAAAVWVVATLLALVMPATIGRILLLIPIVFAAAQRAGLERGSRGAAGLVLAAIVGTYQSGAAILPANAPNLVLVGVAETLYDVHLIYAKYLLLQLPVLAVFKGVAIVALTCWLFAQPIRPLASGHTVPAMSSAEKRLAVVLAVALTLWATDFAHGVKAGWVALAAAIVCLLPRVGMLPAAAFNEIRFSAVIYIGASIGIGGLTASSGLSDALERGLEGVLPLASGADAMNFFALTTLSTVVSLFATNPALPALMGPVADGLAHSAGWTVEAVLMTMAVGFTTLVLPYQVPPLVVGMHAADIKLRAALRMTLPLALFSVVVLIPLDYLWWRLVGYIG